MDGSRAAAAPCTPVHWLSSPACHLRAPHPFRLPPPPPHRQLTDPPVTTTVASWDPGCGRAAGASPGSLTHKGPFLPPPRDGRSWPKHSRSFYTRWPHSSLAGCQPPGPGMSPPVPPKEHEPSPEHWGFVQGGGAEWRVCAARAAKQGGEASRLPHLFTWKQRSRPGPAAAAAGAFMPDGDGECRAAPIPEQPAACQRWGCKQGPGGARTVPDPAACRSWSLRRDVGMGPRPSERWAILLVILCPAVSLRSRALQSPPACAPCRLGPCPGCVSPHCPWVSIPCVAPPGWQGLHSGCMPLLHP